MKTPKQWIEIYNLMDTPTPLEELIRMAQEEAIDEAAKLCSPDERNEILKLKK